MILTIDMAKYKDCDKCGSDNIDVVVEHQDNKVFVYVECTHCGVTHTKLKSVQ